MERSNEITRLIATKTGLGALNPDVKYLGYFYLPNTVPRSRNRMAHSTEHCSVHRAGTEYRRVPVHERDGETYYTNVRGPRVEEFQVDICPSCPQKQESSWREQGNCWGTMDGRSMSTHPSDYRGFISDHCGECPVAQECFQYGVATDALGVWGGFNLVEDYRRREATVKKGNEKYGL